MITGFCRKICWLFGRYQHQLRESKEAVAISVSVESSQIGLFDMAVTTGISSGQYRNPPDKGEKQPWYPARTDQLPQIAVALSITRESTAPVRKVCRVGLVHSKKLGAGVPVDNAFNTTLSPTQTLVGPWIWGAGGVYFTSTNTVSVGIDSQLFCFVFRIYSPEWP